MSEFANGASAALIDGRVTLDGQALKSLRRQRGLSQEDVAEQSLTKRLCLSIASIKRAEAGKAVLYRTARHLAIFYCTELAELVKQAPRVAILQLDTARGTVLAFQARGVIALNDEAECEGSRLAQEIVEYATQRGFFLHLPG